MVTGKNSADRRENGASTIERALDMLRLFARSEHTTLGVTEIATHLGLSKAVVHRMLSSCCSRGFLELDDATHRYRLGPEILMLGLSHLDRIDVRSLGRETLHALVAATNETATLSIKVGSTRVYIDQVTPDRDVKMVVRLGRPFPLHAGASSKVLLAFLPAEQRRAYLETHLAALTPNTITDPDRLYKELEAIRSTGFAVSFAERDASAGSVAAPVFGHEGTLVAVISVSGPLERFGAEVEQASQVLLNATRVLSQRLGYRGERADLDAAPAAYPAATAQSTSAWVG